MKNLLLSLCFAAPFFATTSCGFYATMQTKTYVPDTIAAESGKKTRNGHNITKNGVSVTVEPFDVNEYFTSSYFHKTVRAEGLKFPLVINLFEGMSIFKITIQNETKSDLHYSFKEKPSIYDIDIRYNNTFPIPWETIDLLMPTNVITLPCYWQALGLLEKKFRVGEMKNLRGPLQSEILRTISDAKYDATTPLLNKLGGMGTRYGVNNTITGYLIFPKVEEEDAKLDFIIENNHYSFDIKNTLRFYKSIYNPTLNKYMPYVEITEDEYNAISSQEEKRLRRNNQYTYIWGGGIVGVLLVGAILGL